MTSHRELDTMGLFTEIKNGNEQAKEELCRRYYDRVLAVVRMRLGAKLRSKLESTDIVQETFLRILSGLDRFEYRSEGGLMHWLTKNVERSICDQAEHFAAAKRGAGREKLLGAVPGMDSVCGPISDLAIAETPSGIVAERELLARIEAAVENLAPEQREALLLVRYEGMSLSEAAEMMQKSPDAVRMLVARAIVQLGRLLTSSAR